LDTYEAERHPVGKAVLRSSGGIVRLAMANRPWTLAARAALTAFLGRVRPARTRMVGRLTGVGVAYPAPRGAHRLVGTRVPDVTLKEGRLYEALRDGEFVLILPEGTDHDGDGRYTVTHWASDRRTSLLVRPDGYAAWASDDGPVDGGVISAGVPDSIDSYSFRA
jgi:hypothetical protein